MKALLHKKYIILLTSYLEQRIFLKAFPTSKYSMSLCCFKLEIYYLENKFFSVRHLKTFGVLGFPFPSQILWAT